MLGLELIDEGLEVTVDVVEFVGIKVVFVGGRQVIVDGGKLVVVEVVLVDRGFFGRGFFGRGFFGTAEVWLDVVDHIDVIGIEELVVVEGIKLTVVVDIEIIHRRQLVGPRHIIELKVVDDR